MNYKKLERLTHLLENGTLNQEEFEKEKQSILQEEDCVATGMGYRIRYYPLAIPFF